MAYRERIMVELAVSLRKSPATTLDDLAASMCLHRHTITRLVFESTGLTFRGWKDSMRRDIACDLLLKNPNVSIKEVSYALGFRTTRSFDKFARRVLGCTPTAFRADSPLGGQ
jgi:AraC-like DNA-binding protein